MISPQQQALETLLALHEDYYSVNVTEVPLLEHPSALEFCRQVSQALPCVYRFRNPKDAPDGLSAAAESATDDQGTSAFGWTRSHLENKIQSSIDIAVTPDGRADSLYTDDTASGGKVFLEPATTSMTLAELLEVLDKSELTPTIAKAGPVFYLQSQNSNLTDTALAPLLEDLPQNISFAEEVLGQPDAVNLWIGDEKSVTSIHRDPYENLYLVLKGKKTFTLWAPVDEVVRTGHWAYSAPSGSFSKVFADPKVQIPWIPIDPLLPRRTLNKTYPLYRQARPQTVVVSEGQMLYLPAGWFHHVAQECGTWEDGTRAPCIAVNYWYDQEYHGEKYVMRQMVEKLVKIVHSGSDVPEANGHDDPSHRC